MSRNGCVTGFVLSTFHTRPPPSQPNTYSLQRDQLQNQGYRVQRLEQRNDGSWRANVTRDPVPTRPQGVPKRVTIHPNGQIIEEY